MGDSWDDEDFDPAPVVKSNNIDYSKWDDEDKTETVKSNWEDEDAPQEKKPPKPAPAPKEQKERDVKKEIRKELDAVLSDPDAERRRRKQLEEEADIANAQEAFGGNKEPIIQEIKFTDFVPSTLQDFEKFLEVICGRIDLIEKSPHYINFAKALIKKLVEANSLNSDILKDISKNITVVTNDKMKLEKEKKLGKKKTTSAPLKKQLNLGGGIKSKSGDLDDYGEESSYNDKYDDFM
eukprot:TRINITY_DN4077_c0_g2_i1.p1 TRINITY_DN4077_c0_g2~~TRINITY_DN4077_c0_g2_i1.p1  ORF type:complete len:237 (-),score=75.06 TRINITY_DN4077_c0_g2_i1:22-732(-)